MNNWAFYDQDLNDDGFVFVAWSKSASVPEPTTAALVCAGLMGLMRFGQSRKIRPQ